MSEAFESERAEVVEAVRRVVAAGLMGVASGNVSRLIRRRQGDLIAVTASRVPYHRFTIDDVLVVDFDVEPVVGDAIPSSESLMHVAVYRSREDAGAVIHSHSVYASAFAVAGEPIAPILDEQVVVLGGAIEVATYAAASSEALADAAVMGLSERAAVLLRNHGVLGVGADLDEAVAVVEMVERVARVRLLAGAIGGAHELQADVVAGEQQIYRMLKGFRG